MRWEEVVGQNVRRFREAKGLTQEALAHAASLTTRYVGGIERGTENPTVVALGQLAEALDVHPQALFDDT